MIGQLSTKRPNMVNHAYKTVHAFAYFSASRLSRSRGSPKMAVEISNKLKLAKSNNVYQH